MDHSAFAAGKAVDLFAELTAAEPAAFADRLQAAAGILAAIREAQGEVEEAARAREQHRLEP